ncbi:MAG: fused MFS/spermidine synthase [Planctomycetes bacterium]|nr:fused MFS/spermidine synthase [Planctomycetota bacterium]
MRSPLAAPVLPGIFFFSGLAGLLYEVVWLRMLVRAFGCTTYATSNTLAVFMGGLALGGCAAGRWAARSRSPLAAYGLVELLLAAAGAAASWGAAWLPETFAALCPDGPPHALSVAAVRSLVTCLVLGAPTFLMGATLPLLAEFHARSRAGRRADGGADPTALLYGANTLGAVVGVLFSGFFSLGEWGEARTLAAAVALNVLAGGAALALSRRTASAGEARSAASAAPETTTDDAARGAGVLASRVTLLMAVSGFCALGLEVLWSRMLVLLVGTSVYGFSAMLSVYLAGLGLGSMACAWWLRKPRPLERAFTVLQVGAGVLAAVSLWTYYRLGLERSDPAYLYSPLHGLSDFFSLYVVSTAVVLPTPLLYGALFPLAARLADPSGSGRGVAWLYTLNTLGSVAGSLGFGLLLIPWLGTQGSVCLLVVLHFALAALASAWGPRAPRPAPAARALGTVAVASAGAIAVLALSIPDPFRAILQGRLPKGAELAFHHEGASSTVTVVREGEQRFLYINGIVVNAKGALGRLMAHLPLLYVPAPRRALVICQGVGNTFRAAVDDGVEVDLVELEADVVANFATFWQDAEAYQRHPKVRVVVDDGRHFLLVSSGTYDMIVVDGSPPIFSAGTVNLYTREFVRRARDRLSPDGVLALWVPFGCFQEDFWRIARNFTDAFPSTAAWSTPVSPGVLLLGSRAPLGRDREVIDRRIAERGLLARDDWMSGAVVEADQLGLDGMLRRRTGAYEPVTDDRPYTEFPLPRFLRGEKLIEARAELLRGK